MQSATSKTCRCARLRVERRRLHTKLDQYRRLQTVAQQQRTAYRQLYECTSAGQFLHGRRVEGRLQAGHPRRSIHSQPQLLDPGGREARAVLRSYGVERPPCPDDEAG